MVEGAVLREMDTLRVGRELKDKCRKEAYFVPVRSCVVLRTTVRVLQHSVVNVDTPWVSIVVKGITLPEGA